jgi:hypothetical protein
MEYADLMLTLFQEPGQFEAALTQQIPHFRDSHHIIVVHLFSV